VADLVPLASSGDMDVYCSEASSIPSVLREIGRLRELAFREVGEGTLQALDLDEFDQVYLHLFAWNRKTREVVGAYRVGRTDTILATRGLAGLYTSTLFRYDERLMRRLSPALELGRSFVRREYQRNPNALLLLWKGIGQLVACSPQYRTLFGPVSISSRYRDISQQMLIEFLEQNHRDGDLAQLVEALNPPSLPPLPGRATGTVGELDALISASEPDGKGIPVLLRQYLRLNARVIGFNVDPAFGDALDALVTVDLTEVDPAILNRYLGKQGAAAFVAYHQRRAA
jgi:putative hemolysin